jgi:fatty acid desaturase
VKFHPEEYEFAKRYTRYLHSRNLPFEGLSEEQAKFAVDRGRELYRWFKAHSLLHTAISLSVIVFLLVLDAMTLLLLPQIFLHEEREAFLTLLCVALLIGGLRGWVLYSIGMYSAHEGAAHDLVFPAWQRGPRLLRGIGNNLCVLAGAEPASYTKIHVSHHAYFGTQQDEEFVNFVMPRRFWLASVPLGVVFKLSDFVIDRAGRPERASILGGVAMLAYHGLYAFLTWQAFGALFAILVVIVVSPYVAYELDRLRQFSEHNLMPLERQDGARSFGPGLWGVVVGGGPWGQPCHWMHHLVPVVPWYQQAILHFQMARRLTARQREQYLLQPLLGYPKLLLRLLTEPNRFAANNE